MLSKCYKSTEVDRRTWLHVKLDKLVKSSNLTLFKPAYNINIGR